ncbi:Fibronectin type-III domain-containing protein 3a-like [Homarus americanus]|uniref:Fibronectin type-III domain-containing protein 3a-like n=1 Tax=Homarus americanus TaxID=6706 RepID=A0A8J5N726_HOMAM|nr:Fibronectin type-III domain-containing protein 3a-like [Homarus americanus]
MSQTPDTYKGQNVEILVNEGSTMKEPENTTNDQGMMEASSQSDSSTCPVVSTTTREQSLPECLVTMKTSSETLTNTTLDEKSLDEDAVLMKEESLRVTPGSCKFKDGDTAVTPRLSEVTSVKTPSANKVKDEVSVSARPPSRVMVKPNNIRGEGSVSTPSKEQQQKQHEGSVSTPSKEQQQKEDAMDSKSVGVAEGGGRHSLSTVIRVHHGDGQVITFRLRGANAGQGPPQFFGPPPPGPPPQGYVPPYQPPPQYAPVMSPPLAQPSPPPIYSQKPERHMRQYDKPRTKYYQRQPHQHHNKSETSSLHSTPPLSPKKEPLVRKNGGEEEIQTEDGEDPRNSLQHLLSQVKPPKVINVMPHEAVIQWLAPDLCGLHDDTPVSELLYEVFLNNNSYMSIPATQLTISGLKPATEYRVYFQCLCGTVRGDSSGVTVFQTHSTVPDAPQLPKMNHRSKTSLQFRWFPVKENGSRVTAFILELCGNSGEWTEVYKGRQKQHTIVKLQPHTRYRARVSAVNEHGKSEYSPECVAWTNGVVPSQPAPPVLEQASVTSLSLGWIKRPMEELYTLQMEDSLNSYGFIAVYSGPETRFTCHDLRRNADYKFRLCARNDEGTSPFSDIVCYPTLPDRPKPPSSPTVKGRPKSTKLTLTWTPPADHGGSPITVYRVEIDRGTGFECIYSGESVETECTDLSPGMSYRVRLLCESPGGQSDWSDTAIVTTEAICPGVCQPPRLLGKPKASLLQLKWGHPEYDGGAPVTEFRIDMMSPDNDRRQVYCGRDLECTVASLLPGRPYIFLVRGVNRMGPGPWSEPLEVVSCPHAESSESSSTCGDMESELTFNSAYTGSSTTTEVRNLAPATTYAFRVCCSNSAGVGPWSSHATVTTPAAPPAPVAYISSSPAATAVTLLWGEPANHGDPITHYVIEVGDRTVTTPGPETEYTLNDLQPETLYRIRIQATNSVGPGGFSGIHKITTRPLPPAPPTLELVKASYNSLKLKWGDGRNLDMFYQVYSGTNQNYKVVRLEENTAYHLRICASNEAGVGPYSAVAHLSTTKAPPPPLKAPRVTESPEGSHVVEWCSARCPGEDSIVYRLQVLQAGKDQDYSLVYTGSETSYALTGLEPHTGYYVRVCGVREVGLQWHNLSDQQKAAAILVVFSLFCAIAAIGLHHFLAPDPAR